MDSDNHRIKETVKQNNQTGKVADGEKPWQGSRPHRQGWPQQGGRLHRSGWHNGKLRLRVGCGLWQLLLWEKLPVSHDSPLKSGLEMSRGTALFPLWPLPNRQQEGFPCPSEYLRPCPLTTYNLTGAPNKEIGSKWKNRAKLQKVKQRGDSQPMWWRI